MAYEIKVKSSTRWFLMEVLKGNGDDDNRDNNAPELWL